ncbi:hypothetical protein SDC9_76616 [bioreactor metagenome]|uniref:Uncharacterized protein n=1 Tax=bioreactor metagenome TaxID=1076179 RepID=A0A644YVM1_9ZZZZ
MHFLQESDDKQKPTQYLKLVVGMAAVAITLTGCAQTQAPADRRPAATSSASAGESSYTPKPYNTPANPKPYMEYSPVDPYSDYVRTPQELQELQETAKAYQEKYADEIAELKIPAGLSDQELAETYVERLNQWWNAGIADDPKLLEKMSILDRSGYDQEVASNMLAQDSAFKYAAALFGPDWTSNDSLVYFFDVGLQSNSNIINTATGGVRSGGDLGKLGDTDVKRIDYRANATLESVVVEQVGENSRSIFLTLSAKDTYDELGRVGAANTGRPELSNGKQASYLIDFRSDADRELVTSIIYQ